MNVITLAEIDSTNAYIRRERARLPDGCVVTALRQTEGRGRRGKHWAGDEGMLMFSVLLRGIAHPQTITLAAAVAVCRAVEALIPAKTGIKWPNDVLIGEKKVCGILCESVPGCDSFGGGAGVICGIGVNVSTKEAFFRENSLEHAASLLMVSGETVDKESLLRLIHAGIMELGGQGFGEYRREFEDRCVTIGREILIEKENALLAARAVGVDEDGALLCEDGGGAFSVRAGEVSVRGMY